MHSFYRTLLSPLVALAALLTSFCTPSWAALDPTDLMNRMKSAYGDVVDYQTNVEVKTQKTDGSHETERFLYTFKKPHWIRLDFEVPRAGMIVVYPDEQGKVVIRPSGLIRFLKVRLTPENSLLRVASGQRIDQTDMGLLIENISKSLTAPSQGQLEITEHERHISMRVLAQDHFQDNVVTLYRFIIDKRSWLPIEVQEATPTGEVRRSVIFRDLRTNTGIPDSFFQLDG
jgi:outer membrane lipoprotein-sorting protein